MGYTPEWEGHLRRLRLDITEFARIAGISQPQMAKIARGELRRPLSTDMKARINAALERHCPKCKQYWEKAHGSDQTKAQKGGGAR